MASVVLAQVCEVMDPTKLDPHPETFGRELFDSVDWGRLDCLDSCALAKRLTVHDDAFIRLACPMLCQLSVKAERTGVYFAMERPVALRLIYAATAEPGKVFSSMNAACKINGTEEEICYATRQSTVREIEAWNWLAETLLIEPVSRCLLLSSSAIESGASALRVKLEALAQREAWMLPTVSMQGLSNGASFVLVAPGAVVAARILRHLGSDRKNDWATAASITLRLFAGVTDHSASSKSGPSAHAQRPGFIKMTGRLNINEPLIAAATTRTLWGQLDLKDRAILLRSVNAPDELRRAAPAHVNINDASEAALGDALAEACLLDRAIDWAAIQWKCRSGQSTAQEKSHMSAVGARTATMHNNEKSVVIKQAWRAHQARVADDAADALVRELERDAACSATSIAARKRKKNQPQRRQLSPDPSCNKQRPENSSPASEQPVTLMEGKADHNSTRTTQENITATNDTEKVVPEERALMTRFMSQQPGNQSLKAATVFAEENDNEGWQHVALAKNSRRRAIKDSAHQEVVASVLAQTSSVTSNGDSHVLEQMPPSQLQTDAEHSGLPLCDDQRKGDSIIDTARNDARAESSKASVGEIAQQPKLSSEIADMAASLRVIAQLRESYQFGAASRLRDVVTRLWPAACVEVYGSVITSLAVPGSDVDIVVSRVPTWWWSAGPKQQPLNALASELSLESWVSSARTVGGSVPLIKVETALVPTNHGDRSIIKLDVSFDVNGDNPWSAVSTQQLINNSSSNQQSLSSSSHISLRGYLAYCRSLRKLAAGLGNEHLDNIFSQPSPVAAASGCSLQSIPTAVIDNVCLLTRDLANANRPKRTTAHDGILNTLFVLKLRCMHPQLAPLVIVLKQLLYERGLNDPYHGGLPSYALVVMVAAVLQCHVLKPPREQPDLGSLFLETLAAYGTRQLDPRRSCIRIRSDGCGPLAPLTPAQTSTHVPRVGTTEYWRPADPVIIEDPLHPQNNLGKSCFGFRQVQLVFDDAYRALKEHVHTYDRHQAHHSDTSSLGAAFQTRHHDSVVRHLRAVWCPSEESSSQLEQKDVSLSSNDDQRLNDPAVCEMRELRALLNTNYPLSIQAVSKVKKTMLSLRRMSRASQRLPDRKVGALHPYRVTNFDQEHHIHMLLAENLRLQLRAEATRLFVSHRDRVWASGNKPPPLAEAYAALQLNCVAP